MADPVDVSQAYTESLAVPEGDRVSQTHTEALVLPEGDRVAQSYTEALVLPIVDHVSQTHTEALVIDPDGFPEVGFPLEPPLPLPDKHGPFRFPYPEPYE